ncbi:HD-domain/PDEase-like protein [Piromyces finnis]|uniref:HD-domain/PDEase-like protein n=1 Tax=Piromyces finnis TaxID=1754191 RepID=A0A1Y1VHB3_9FUNG|nr:HD-domain/PDEase-like protein [Piromyces finnis]|eukprot:ORX56099.1 HD-domain/PDEase-like protein [Piromyces finnis]
MDFNFDIFKLSNITNCQPIFYLGKHIFDQHNFNKHFNIKLSTLESFLTTMENQYHMALPYHNNIHAADVLHAMNYFISHPVLDNLLTIEEKFACIISAIIHDIDHPGINNSYEIKHSEPLSVIYNNKSVLENHHCALAFKILHEYINCNILKNVTKSQYTYIRSLIIAMVLATDMACHKQFVDEFTEKLKNQTFNIEDSKDRKLLLCILIKCADISNPTKINKISVQWSNRLFKENLILSVNEKKHQNYNLSPLLKNNCTSKSENQTSFIKIFVKPIYQLLGSFLEIDDFIAIRQLEENYNFWEE